MEWFDVGTSTSPLKTSSSSDEEEEQAPDPLKPEESEEEESEEDESEEEEEEKVSEEQKMSAPTVTTPKHGGVTEGVAWTGGKPSKDFAKTTLTKPMTPNGYHLTDPTKAQKSYKYRTKHQVRGEGKVFERSEASYSLMSFLSDAKRHMEENGMDTVFYFPDPSDGEQSILFDYHSRSS